MNDKQLVQEKRDAAERTGRLLFALPPQSEDRKVLIAYARELDAEADELERQMVAAEKSRFRVRMHQERRHSKLVKPNDDEPKRLWRPGREVGNRAFWSDRAKEARTIADEITDEGGKTMMLQVAALYDEMALRIEARQTGAPTI